MKTKSIGNGWHIFVSKKENKNQNQNQNKPKKASEKEKSKIKKNAQFFSICSESGCDEFDDFSKKILCQNIINDYECKYGDKCMYAHSLDEQNVSELRKYAYDIIKNNVDLSDITPSDELYKILFLLTRYCKNCYSKNCIGGYNCKSGACDKKYVVCLNDLNYGKCDDIYCTNVHLSKKGLKPYYHTEEKNNTNLMLDCKKNDTNLDSCSESDICSVSNSELDSNTDGESNIENDKKNHHVDLCEESIFS